MKLSEEPQVPSNPCDLVRWYKQSLPWVFTRVEDSLSPPRTTPVSTRQDEGSWVIQVSLYGVTVETTVFPSWTSREKRQAVDPRTKPSPPGVVVLVSTSDVPVLV